MIEHLAPKDDPTRTAWEKANPGICDMCGQPGDLEPGAIFHGIPVGYVCSKCCPREKSAWDSWEWMNLNVDSDTDQKSVTASS